MWFKKSYYGCSYCVKCIFTFVSKFNNRRSAWYYLNSCWIATKEYLLNYKRYGLEICKITTFNNFMCNSSKPRFNNKRGAKINAGNRSKRWTFNWLSYKNRYNESWRWCNKNIKKPISSTSIWLCWSKESLSIGCFK